MYKNLIDLARKAVKAQEINLHLVTYARFDRNQYGCHIDLFLAERIGNKYPEIIELFSAEKISDKMFLEKKRVKEQRIHELYESHGIIKEESDDSVHLECDYTLEEIEEYAYINLLKKAEVGNKLKSIVDEDVYGIVQIYYKNYIVGEIEV